MSEFEQGQFDVCPKCGGVARDGICQSCGYEIPGIREKIDAERSAMEEQSGEVVYTMPDVYQSQSGQDIYQSPDIHVESRDTGGLFSGAPAPEDTYTDAQNQDYRPFYPGQPNPFGNGQYTNQQYGSGQYTNQQYGNGQYTNQQYGSGQYTNQQYGNGQYTNQPYGNMPYGNNQYGNNAYGNGQYENNSYGNQQYGNPQYENSQYGGNQYGNNQHGSQPYGSPYGNAQYGYPPYSPYAVPPKKKHTGLIIGVIIAVAILFFIAILTLLYHAIETAAKRRNTEYLEEFYQDYFEDFDREHSTNDKKNDSFVYDDTDEDITRESDDPEEDSYDDYDDDYGYDDYYDDYNYDDDEYYTLHDDIKELSYSVNWEDYVYDTNEENVSIMVQYPVIVGSHIPNLDKINSVIAEEAYVFTDYFEEEYIDYMYDEDSYFNAYSAGYVTYMSEDILSIVFSEYVYSDYFDSIYLYCINVDMQDGVILDNTDIIAVDDDFSIDFRYRSDEQNGSIYELDWMTDQEITELLTYDGSLIIFYTPQGMEIGFNYDEGWVTVTYRDYKDYLKIF